MRASPYGKDLEDEDVFAVAQLVVDSRLVGDVGAHAAVAGRIGRRHRRITVDRIAAVEVERVVNALRVVAGLGPVELEMAGDGWGRGLAGGDRIDAVRLVALREHQDLLGERDL